MDKKLLFATNVNQPKSNGEKVELTMFANPLVSLPKKPKPDFTFKEDAKKLSFPPLPKTKPPCS
jgi:hypothetical protein